MFLQLFVTWLVAMSTMVLAQPPLNAPGPFSSSCTNIQLEDLELLLHANCSTTQVGVYLKNTLDLNLCIGVDNSSNTIEWGVYGKLANSCSHCYLNPLDPSVGWELVCDCKAASNNIPIQVSSLYLDDGIKNTNGTMTCIGGAGTIG